MFKNYLTMALRQLRKKPLYTSLNIFGLGLGVAACLLITLYVVHELSYDRWNPLAERIVRPVSDINFAGNHFEMAVTGSVVAPEAAKELPDITSWTRIRDRGSYLVKREGQGHQNIREENVLTVDSSFFEVFPLKIVAGDPDGGLNQPQTMAISRSWAEKYFPNPQMAVGQTLLLENRDRWQITAVYEDLPTAAHFKAHLLLSMTNDSEVKNDPPFWGANNNFHTYFLLHKEADKAAFSKKFGILSAAKMAITAQQLIGSTVEELAKTGQYARYELQNLSDIHLHSDLSIELQPNGSIRYVWILGAIAAFILLIACINFMNLATARSAGRAKEVGVRKSLGSGRSALIGQFLSESLLLTAMAVALGVLVSAMALPAFSRLADRTLSMPWNQPVFWAALAGGIGLTGLLAGSYPAFFLSAFNAVRMLKGNPLRSAGGSLRSALVVFQFAISVALIFSTLLVFRQLHFIQSKKLGFDKSQVVILDDAYALGNRVYNFKEEMLKNAAIESGTVSGFLPVTSNRSDQTFSKTPSFNKDNSVAMQHWRVDSDYRKTLGLEIATGRDFDPARLTDSSAIILNESAVRKFGFSDPIGQKVYTLTQNIQGPPRPEDFEALTVVGVVKDFHFESLRNNIGALCLRLGTSPTTAAFRYKGTETAAVVAALEKQWKSMAPDQPFAVRFLDDAFGRMYRAESRVAKIAGVFALLSVLISCLGLFGLAAFTAEQRTKEIGVRKVLGASVAGITGLLAKDFLKLVIVAIAIASPVAYFFMHRWLSDFAYRIDIEWWMFAAAGAVAVLLAFLTVSFQSVRAAVVNPVKSLRSE
jgi:putative ABC transport system permease protein